MPNHNNIKLWKKFILIYILGAILPITFIGYSLTDKLQNLTFESIVKLSNASLKQLTQNITDTLFVYKDIADSLANDSRLNAYVSTYYEEPYDAYYDYVNLIDPLMSRLHYRDSNMSIRIFSNNMTIRFSRNVNNSLDYIVSQNWIDFTQITNSDSGWIGIESPIQYYNKEYLGYFRVLPSSQYQNGINSIYTVLFDEKKLYSLIANEGSDGKIVFLLDENGYVITSTQRDTLHKNIDSFEDTDNKIWGEAKNGSILNYSNASYLVMKANISNDSLYIKDWALVYLIPASGVFASINSIQISSITLYLISIIISFILVLLLSNNITGRLNRLVKKIDQIKAGKYKINMTISGQDEIGLLENNFIGMASEIDNLVNEVLKADLKIKDIEIKNQKSEMQRKEAEIIALQEQINPHYLFNTIETIRMKLLLKGDRETSEVMKIFGETFRFTIDNTDHHYTFVDELKFTEDYFKVQKFRYGDKLKYTKKIDDEILACRIPKLILQPLMENAIYHGLELKKDGGTIILEAYKQNDQLIIRVSDDGVGIEKDELQRILLSICKLNQMDEKKHNGNRIALININARIRLEYGNEYGLRIDSQKGYGTVVEINLPFHIDN